MLQVGQQVQLPTPGELELLQRVLEPAQQPVGPLAQLPGPVTDGHLMLLFPPVAHLCPPTARSAQCPGTRPSVPAQCPATGARCAAVVQFSGPASHAHAAGTSSRTPISSVGSTAGANFGEWLPGSVAGTPFSSSEWMSSSVNEARSSPPKCQNTEGT